MLKKFFKNVKKNNNQRTQATMDPGSKRSTILMRNSPISVFRGSGGYCPFYHYYDYYNDDGGDDYDDDVDDAENNDDKDNDNIYYQERTWERF